VDDVNPHPLEDLQEDEIRLHQPLHHGDQHQVEDLESQFRARECDLIWARGGHKTPANRVAVQVAAQVAAQVAVDVHHVVKNDVVEFKKNLSH
tara:strand:- start:240 stop:518 length:279 start_codon:yes stop_codon:yes gene_type:complete